jgi:hypothetical protein
VSHAVAGLQQPTASEAQYRWTAGDCMSGQWEDLRLSTADDAKYTVTSELLGR